MVGIFHPLRQGWCRFRFDGVISIYLNSMRIMAFGADPPPLFSACCPHADSLAVYARPPVNIDFTVALAAELLRLIE